MVTTTAACPLSLMGGGLSRGDMLVEKPHQGFLRSPFPQAPASHLNPLPDGARRQTQEARRLTTARRTQETRNSIDAPHHPNPLLHRRAGRRSEERRVGK